MAEETVARTADRIVEHVRAHRIPEVRVILHGGEPLLLGVTRMESLLGVLTERLAGECTLHLVLQTNGLLLTGRMLELLLRFRVRVGVSVDGAADVHDRHRRRPDGRPSHLRTVQSITRLASPRFRALFGGVLCTIDLEADPVATYEALLAFAPPRIGLLLPHGTWETPPPGLAHRTEPAAHPPTGAEHTPYAAWLGAVFDRWFDQPRQETRIRLFEEVMSGLLGGSVRSEALGLDPPDLVVVETDGTIEQPDSLKVAFHGAAATGLDIFGNSFDDALLLQGFAEGRGEVCGRCALLRVCGGGLRAHRFHSSGEFSNPSVYCADLAAFITHVRKRVTVALEATAASPEGD
jgi:uncharacterized protein